MIRKRQDPRLRRSWGSEQPKLVTQIGLLWLQFSVGESSLRYLGREQSAMPNKKETEGTLSVSNLRQIITHQH